MARNLLPWRGLQVVGVADNVAIDIGLYVFSRRITRIPRLRASSTCTCSRPLPSPPLSSKITDARSCTRLRRHTRVIAESELSSTGGISPLNLLPLSSSPGSHTHGSETRARRRARIFCAEPSRSARLVIPSSRRPRSWAARPFVRTLHTITRCVIEVSRRESDLGCARNPAQTLFVESTQTARRACISRRSLEVRSNSRAIHSSSPPPLRASETKAMPYVFDILSDANTEARR